MTSTLTKPNPAPTKSEDRTSLMLGALYALVFANLVQLASGLAGIDPSPPPNVLPFIAAIAALGITAIPLVRDDEPTGSFVGIAFCLVSMVGMGPHKLFLEDGLIIAPLALVGFALEVIFIRTALLRLRRRS